MQNSILQWFAAKFLDRPLSPRQLLTARKWVYGALILLLFTGSFFWRHYLVEAQANELAVREESHGDLELSGSVLRLTLTGSRGLATCALWVNAIDTQKKNQWNELEFQVRWLTRLQPHFITPWLFQSWNLAYNVSVESDRISDKYFYITRGIALLYEGERQNRDNPDMRSQLGFYTQHKICNSDETNVHRSLLQLSCIPPNERDPARFWKGEGAARTLNWEEFEKFCREHPRLVRRLHEGLRRDTQPEQKRQFTCKRPEDVVQFLADNFRVPSLYEEVTPTPEGTPWRKLDVAAKKPLEDRFPMLPPPHKPPPPQRLFQPTESWVELTSDSVLGEDVDGFAVARAWYCYAQEPIPDPDRFPGMPKEVSDRARQRRPRQMTTLLFRQQPALAQAHRSDALQVEGWFDTSPWEIRGWFDEKKVNDKGEVYVVKVVKTITDIPEGMSSQKSWELASEMWRTHGEQNLVLFRNPAEEVNKRELAEKYWKRTKTPVGSLPYAPSNINPLYSPRERERQSRQQLESYIRSLPEEEKEEYEAARYLYDYQFYRTLSNFVHHFSRSQVEAKPPTVQARRLLFEAETYRILSPESALRAYWDPEHPRDGAVSAWLGVLLANKDFREDRFIQEQTADYQLRYMDLVKDLYGRRLKLRLADQQMVLVQAGYALQPVRTLAGGIMAPTVNLLLADYHFPPGMLPTPKGPFDIEVKDDKGNSKPLIDPQAMQTILNRRGQTPPQQKSKEEEKKQQKQEKPK